MKTKHCPKCDRTQSTDNFHRNARRPDGLASYCKPCKKAATRAWKQANPERVREHQRAWKKANAEREREQKRAYYQANREHILEQERAWYQANREHKRAYYQANRERKLATDRAWYQANPEKARLKNHKRRDRESCAVPQRWIVDHSLGDPLACWWCGRGLLGAKSTIEHVMPVKLKGPTVPSNLVTACSTCNARKFRKHPLVWLAEIVS